MPGESVEFEHAEKKPGEPQAILMRSISVNVALTTTVGNVRCKSINEVSNRLLPRIIPAQREMNQRSVQNEVSQVNKVEGSALINVGQSPEA